MNCLANPLVVILVVLISTPVFANNCQTINGQQIEQSLLRLNNTAIQAATLARNISVQCSATGISNAKGFTKPDFRTGRIQIFLQDGLPVDSLTSTLTHELQHAVQYFQWLNPRNESLLAKMLTELAGMMTPGKLNGSFQVRAGLKKHPVFRHKPKLWLQAYTNVFFCMEYQAWQVEADYVKLANLDSSYTSEHVRQYLKGDSEVLTEFLNQTVVKQYWDSEFTPRQLALALQSCPRSSDPVEMFRASIEALNLKLSPE